MGDIALDEVGGRQRSSLAIGRDYLVHVEDDEGPAVHSLAVVMMSMFQAYAAMQNLQFQLKKTMHVGQEGDRAHVFTWAVTMLHVGKLVSRLAHNVLCACLSPVTRVYISMCFVVIASAVPAVFVFNLQSDWLGWVFISYFLIGVGIGVFEATFLAVIAPLGKRTKSSSIIGIPTGFLIIGVPGFLLLGIGLPVQWMYWYVVACTIGSMVIVHHYAPKEEAIDSSREKVSLLQSLQAWRLWLPWLLPHLLGKMFVNFGMENLFPVIGFTFNDKMVPFWGPASDTLVSKDFFQAGQNLIVFFGDTVSRRLPYLLTSHKHSTSACFIAGAIACEIIAFLLMKLAVAWVAWFAIGLAFFGNGLVYAVGSRHIDKLVPKEHHLAAYSLWCFMGDISSVVGARSQDFVRGWICNDIISKHECLD